MFTDIYWVISEVDTTLTSVGAVWAWAYVIGSIDAQLRRHWTHKALFSVGIASGQPVG
jgi:hypothetical protein